MTEREGEGVVFYNIDSDVLYVFIFITQDFKMFNAVFYDIQLIFAHLYKIV